MFDKKFITILSIIIGVIVVAGIAVVLVGQKQIVNGVNQTENQTNQQNEVNINQEDQVNSENNEAIDNHQAQQEPDILTSDIDTSDWQTYRDEEYGFEFRYPNLGAELKVNKGGEPRMDPCGHDKCIEYDDQFGHRFSIALNSSDDTYYYDSIIENNRESDSNEEWYITNNDVLFRHFHKEGCGTFLFENGSLNILIGWNCKNVSTETMKALMATWKFL